jgi:phage major head subunit gpT-like protein
MATTTMSDLSALVTGAYSDWKVMFNQAFLADRNQPNIDRFATRVPSNTYQEIYTWLGDVPQMAAWLDERQFDSLVTSMYTLPNADYAAGIEVDRNAFLDNTFNMFDSKVKQLGRAAALHPAIVAMQVLEAGQTALCYDGQPFFATTHADYTGLPSQSNLLTGTGTTLSAVRADLVAGRVAGKRFTDQHGRILNLTFDAVIAPPEMEDVLRQLLNTTMIALSSGTQMDNVLRAEFDLIINPYLTSTNDWYLVDTKEEIKPLIFQDRQAPDFQMQTDPTLDNVFIKKKYRFGVDSRFGLGYGPWMTAIKINN